MYETIGLSWHYGFIGLATGCSANSLTHDIGDANTMIPEYKAFLCDIQTSPIILHPNQRSLLISGY